MRVRTKEVFLFLFWNSSGCADVVEVMLLLCCDSSDHGDGL